MILTRLLKKHSVYCFVEREKMDDTLMELNLETLAAIFRREIIVPSIVQSMNNEKITRLRVTAIGNREQEQVIILLSKCWKPLNKQNPQCTLRNECVFSILGVLRHCLQVQVFLASLFSSACKTVHVHLLLFSFAKEIFLIKNTRL